MREIVIPTFLSLFQPIAETLRQIAESGVRLIEIHGDAPETHIDLTDDSAVEALAQAIRELPLEIYSVHCAFSKPSEEAWDISQPNAVKRAAALRRRTMVIQAAARLGAHHIVIHPGVRHRSKQRLAHCRAGLIQLTEVARTVGIRVAVENLPPDHLGGSLAEIAWLLDGLDPTIIGFCLDTGHAMLGKDSLEGYIHTIGNRLFGIHWHGNTCGNDSHWFPEVHEKRWISFLHALDEVKYNLPITLEAVPPLTTSLPEALEPVKAFLQGEHAPDNKRATIADLRRAFSELERRIDAVRHIAVRLSTATKADDLIREALITSLALAQSEAGSILLYRSDKKKLVFEHVVGEKANELMGMELEPGQGIAGMVFQTGKTSVLENVAEEHAHLREVGERIGYFTTNMVTVPLKSAEAEPLGVMQVLNKRNLPFDEHDVKLIETIGAQIATALITVSLHEQARLAEIMRFIGNVSHDVKNMVTPAVMGAETLQLIADSCFQKFDQELTSSALSQSNNVGIADTMASLRELYPEIVELIIGGCEAVQQRMAEISAAVKGIVSEPQFEPSDVLAIARRVVAMLTIQAQKKKIALTIESGVLPVAMLDGKQIHNALYNLVFNAIDACREGDAVVVQLKGRADGQFPAGNYILLECADTGPGIPEQVKAKLFTDKAISTKPMGTGLGTRIVKNVIDAHGGTIEVESKLGVGTTIRCRIPTARAVDTRKA